MTTKTQNLNSNRIPDSLLEIFRKYDTPTICNALELIDSKYRLQGFTTEQMVCADPSLPPIVGYARTATIRATFPVDPQAKLEELARRYGDGRLEQIDGISVSYEDWHFNVRASNTEPLLRLNLEALTQQRMEDKRDEVLAIIRA